jgi:hypothetical protein
MGYAKLARYANKGVTIKTTSLTNEFSYKDHEKEYKNAQFDYVRLKKMAKVEMFTCLENST